MTHLFTPFVAAAALAMVALIGTHDAIFLTLRLPTRPVSGTAGTPDRPAATAAPATGGGPAAAATRLGRRLIPVTLVTVGSATVLGLLSDQVRASIQRPARPCCGRCCW